MEKFNGEIDVEYKYGYLDKVIEVNCNGKITKFAYDGFGMLVQKTFHDGSTEVWVWDGLALIRRGSDIYVNEPHISGGVPILSKTDEGVRYHEHDFLGTTLWSTDTKGSSAASIEGQAPYAVAIRKSAIPAFVKALQELSIKATIKTIKTQRYLAREASKKTVPHALPANLTTKTCRRMYSHTAITMPPPPAGAPQI